MDEMMTTEVVTPEKTGLTVVQKNAIAGSACAVGGAVVTALVYLFVKKGVPAIKRWFAARKAAQEAHE